jgi:hypothetical protein
MGKSTMAAALAFGMLLTALPGNAAAPPFLPSGHGNINIHLGFSSNEIARIRSELNGLASNNFSYYIPSGALITPYNEVLQFTSLYIPGGSAQLLGSTTSGSGRRPVKLYDLLFAQPAVIMRTVMLHEADHHRFGAHTCGQGADLDDNGPFGVGAYYAALLSQRSTNLDASQREVLANFARAITVSQICSAAAQNNLFNAINFGIFAPPPPPPPPAPPPPDPTCGFETCNIP